MLLFNRYWPTATSISAFVMANRARFVLYMAGDLMQSVILYFLWTAAFAQRSQVGGMDHTTMVTYIFVAQACRMITAYSLEGQVAMYIQSGDIIRDLIVPQTYLWNRFWFMMGWLVTIGGLTVVPWMVAGLLFFRVALPPLAMLPALVISLCMAMAISFGLSFITGTIAFWTDGGLWGISMAKGLLISFTSGAFIPLTLFPGWLATAAEALPFQAGVTIPTQIYLGQLHGGGLWAALGVQAFWVAALLTIGGRFFNYSLRKMTIPGG